MSGSPRSFPPSRTELRQFCHSVFAACETCAKEPYLLPGAGFAPCELCAGLIDVMLDDFNNRLARVVPVVKACATCRPRIDVELAKGDLHGSTELCEACSAALSVIYSEGLN